MSTRSAIIEKTNNTFRGIYCHFDGYLSGVGQTLQSHYVLPGKVSELIDLGDISSLGPAVSTEDIHTFDNPKANVTVAYHRDRGESDTEAHVTDSLEDIMEYFKGSGVEYIYIFDSSKPVGAADQWSYYSFADSFKTSNTLIIDD